jgi:hypothetical protein
MLLAFWLLAIWPKPMTTTAQVKTRLQRQDALLEEMLTILKPQLDGQACITSGQFRALQTAIAQYTNELHDHAAASS